MDGSISRFATPGFNSALVSAHEALQTEELKRRDPASGTLALGKANNAAESREQGLTEAARYYLASSPLEAGSKALLFLFLAHCLVLETLSVQERALQLANVNPSLLSHVVDGFLPNIFLAIESVATSSSATFDVDGRLFIALVDFYTRNSRSSSFEQLLGADLHNRLATIWSDLGLEEKDLGILTQHSPPIDTISAQSHPSPDSISLLPFKNSVFDQELSIIKVEVDENDEDFDEAAPKFDFGQGVLFSDTNHWHNAKAILPRHLGGEDNKPVDERHRMRLLKGEQRFMANLQRQAGTLTGALGASLQQIVIPPVGSRVSKASGKGKAHVEVARVSFQLLRPRTSLMRSRCEASANY